jgi:hypothetical protein
MYETRICQNCKADFIIDERDQNYYKKINVPHPTWCPECRTIRRMSFHNLWSVYWRTCAKCNKKTLSMFNPDIAITVYCSTCWWADDWDGTEFAMEYDPTRNFFEQLNELSRKTPWSALETLASSLVNSEYCNGVSYIKNGYLSFWADYCENIAHSSILFQVKDVSDCMRAKESQLCYESIGINKCYQTYFSEECDACTNVWFSRNCYNCTNCIGCVNLRGENYCIFNEKYSKEEYAKKITELGLDSWEALQALEKQARAFWLSKPYRSYTGNSLNLNVTGEYVFESKNSDNLYLCTSTEESRYCQFVTVPSAKDCYDYSGWGASAELMYETTICGEQASNIKFSFSCYPNTMNVEYSIWASAAKNCFGCINLKRKQYCILNKEYSKEEYEKLRAHIISDMEKNPYVDPKGRTWSYGEFFPFMINMYGYNESNALRFFSKSKEEALAEGFQWYETNPMQYTITVTADDLPDTFEQTPETITNEVIGCDLCGRGYKIAPLEYMLLQKANLPIPRCCPQCRLKSRFARLNPIKLWKRACMKCTSEINTAFSPEQPEIVYCESCYQQEFV